MLKLVASVAIILAASQAQALRYTGSNAYHVYNFHRGNLHFDLEFSRPVSLSSVSGVAYSIYEFGDTRDGIYNEGYYETPLSYVQLSSTHFVADQEVSPAFHKYGPNFGIYERDYTFNTDVAGPARLTLITSGPATVPEPASWVMMIAGFGLVAGLARRQRELRPAVSLLQRPDIRRRERSSGRPA